MLNELVLFRLSNLSCSNKFMGISPFSEMETQNIRDFVLDHNDRLVLFEDVHSYGQYIMYPWGHLEEDNPYLDDNIRVADAVSNCINDAVNKKARLRA